MMTTTSCTLYRGGFRGGFSPHLFSVGAQYYPCGHTKPQRQSPVLLYGCFSSACTLNAHTVDALSNTQFRLGSSHQPNASGEFQFLDVAGCFAVGGGGGGGAIPGSLSFQCTQVMGLFWGGWGGSEGPEMTK